MKVLVCKNKHCRHHGSDGVIKKLEQKASEKGVEVLHSSCMDLCEAGPNVMLFPSLKLYGEVEEKDIDRLLNNDIEYLRHPDSLIYDKEILEAYFDNPMHHRTVKLFRYHLEKYDNMAFTNLIDIIKVFQTKYALLGNDFSYPVKVSILGTVKGPDLPKVIHLLGKERTIDLMNTFLKKVSSR